MLAVIVTAPGAPELVEVPTPEPGAGEILIEVAAAAVNPVDAFTAAGGPRDAGWVAPDAVLGLGWDVVGTVVAAGDGVSWPATGAVVAAVVPNPSVATFAQFVVVAAADVAAVPTALSDTDAASIPLAALTASQALDLAGEPAGELLVTGAAGAVGGYAVSLAARAGWAVTGLARDSDRGFVLDAGAEDVISAIGGTYAAALDTAVLGDPVAAVVRDGGRYVGVIPGAAPASDRIGTTAISVRADGARLAELLELAAQGALPSRVRATYPLSRFDEALADAARPGRRGKVVITV